MEAPRVCSDLPVRMRYPYDHWYDGEDDFSPPFCIDCGNLVRPIDNMHGGMSCTCGSVTLRCRICCAVSCQSFCTLCGTHAEEYGLECTCWDEVRELEETALGVIDTGILVLPDAILLSPQFD